MHGGLVSRFIHSQKKGAEELNFPPLFSFLRVRFARIAAQPRGIYVYQRRIETKKGRFQAMLDCISGCGVV